MSQLYTIFNEGKVSAGLNVDVDTFVTVDHDMKAYALLAKDATAFLVMRGLPPVLS